MLPEHSSYAGDLADGILAQKETVEKTISDPGIRKRVIDSIKNLQDASTNLILRNQLKRGKNVKHKIDISNIVQGSRKRKSTDDGVEAKPIKEQKKA